MKRPTFDALVKDLGDDPKRVRHLPEATEPNEESGGVSPDEAYREAGKPGPGMSEGPFKYAGFEKQAKPSAMTQGPPMPAKRKYARGGAVQDGRGYKLLKGR